MKKFSKPTCVCIFIIIFTAALLSACSGGAIANGDYEGPGVTVQSSESLSIFIPENFTVKGNKFTIKISLAGIGEYSQAFTIEYTYKVSDGELTLLNSDGNVYGTFPFEKIDGKTFLIGGEEYKRK